MAIKDEITDLKEAVTDIRDNHLPHIYKTVTALEVNMTWIKKGVFGMLGILGAIFLTMVGVFLK